MDKNRNFTACSMELLDDPALKTTATNYEFKDFLKNLGLNFGATLVDLSFLMQKDLDLYVPGDQLQRVIRTVQRDRLKQKKDSIWSEFCSVKRPSLTNPKETDLAANIQQRIYQDPRNVIKTKASTIKIISQPIVETKSENNSAKSKESYKPYKVPKIRIMTDEEIKSVVENAFKEVMDQTGKSKMVSQLLTTRRSKNRPDDELICSIPEEDLEELSPKWIPADENRILRSSRTERSVKNSEIAKLECEVPCIVVSNDSQLNLTDDEEEPNSDRVKNSVRSKRSDRSMKSDQSSKHDSDVEIRYNLNDLDSDEFEKEEERAPERKEDPDISMTPELTCIEKEEFRKFLGIEELIVTSEIDLDRYDENSSSSSEDENEENHEAAETIQNIEPLIRIRQPTPRLVRDDDSEEDIVLHSDEPPPKLGKPLQVVKSPKKKTFTSVSPRKRFDTSPLKSPFSPKSSPLKSPLPAPVKAAASQRKLKKIKSPQLLSDARQLELKQEQMAILSKITTYQTKIIQAMHQIRLNLNEDLEPDGNIDQKRRERRAEEFTTRFARNYLYQISRWIEEIRVIPKEQYISRFDNEFRIKVCNLFGILYQAMQSYLKHMKSFLVDRNPRKLPVLIDAISESTKMCVHKKVFDKEDDLVKELLYKTKSMRLFLQEIVEQVGKPTTKKPEKGKNPKAVKSEIKFDAAPRPTKKLSMYDSLPTTISGLKRKGISSKGTARSKTSVRSLAQQPSTELKIGQRKPDKRSMSQKPSIQKLPIAENYKDDVFEIQTPRIDQVNTHVETMLYDESQEVLSAKLQNRLVENIIADMNSNQPMADTSDRGQDINNTVIEALESITKQQVQQILGPLMSNLGVLMTDKTGAGMNVNTLLQSLSSVTSHLVNGPSASGETFNRQDVNLSNQQYGTNVTNNYNNNENNLMSSRSKGVSVSYDVGDKVHDNAASYERELAANRFQQQQNQIARVAPAPNAFGELHNNDELPTSPYTTVPSMPGMAHTFGDCGGTRAPRINEGHEPVQDEGGDYGASTSEVETKKVQQLRYDRNVQFTFVTSNEEIVESEPIKEKEWDQVAPPNTPLKPDPLDISKYKARIFQDRMHFLEQLADNPLYVNEYISEPWKMVTRIASEIVSDAMSSVESCVNFGEEKFVKDFIRMELNS